MNELHKSRPLVWGLLVAFTLAWLYVLGIRTLVPPDEGRYAEMAREMWLSGDWITTRLNGIKYFEKPPLQTWMNALTFAVFGLGEWQARLWTGLCGLLGVFSTAYAALKVFGARTGLYAGLVLGSSLYWVAAGQANSLDMALAGMMTLALAALLIAQHDGAGERERRHWMLVCWAAMALAVLSKGLVGVVLPGAVLVLYTLASRDWNIWARLNMVRGLLLFFAIATPWFVLVGLKNPEQPHFFFIREHFERFVNTDHNRTGAWYYFVGPLVAGSAPWLGIALQSLAAAVRPGAERTRFQPRTMLVAWAGFIFFFFSYSSSKLPGYIVPVFPALAILGALFLASAPRRDRMLAAALPMLTGVAALVLAWKAPGMLGKPGEMQLVEAYQPWVAGAGLVSLLGGALAMALARLPERRDLMVMVLAVSGFASTEMVLTGFEVYGKHRAATAMIAPIKAELTPASTVFAVGTYEQSLPFYLERTVVLVDYLDEFSFGLQQEPHLAIPTVDAFVTRWTADARAGVRDFAVMREDMYRRLQQQGVTMRVVAQDTRRMVVANR
jgi:4-amino-4-deoxy-L-arabinose transferase-like glycosyltransferase